METPTNTIIIHTQSREARHLLDQHARLWKKLCPAAMTVGSIGASVCSTSLMPSNGGKASGISIFQIG